MSRRLGRFCTALHDKGGGWRSASRLFSSPWVHCIYHHHHQYFLSIQNCHFDKSVLLERETLAKQIRLCPRYLASVLLAVVGRRSGDHVPRATGRRNVYQWDFIILWRGEQQRRGNSQAHLRCTWFVCGGDLPVCPPGVPGLSTIRHQRSRHATMF